MRGPRTPRAADRKYLINTPHANARLPPAPLRGVRRVGATHVESRSGSAASTFTTSISKELSSKTTGRGRSAGGRDPNSKPTRWTRGWTKLSTSWRSPARWGAVRGSP